MELCDYIFLMIKLVKLFQGPLFLKKVSLKRGVCSLSSPLVLIPHAWNADVMTGALLAILGLKETLKVETVLVKTEQ